MKRLLIVVSVISISATLIYALVFIKRTHGLTPQALNITDGKRATYFVCSEYEKHILDKGRKGYLIISKKIYDTPKQNELIVYLRILASYYDTYQRIGVDSLGRIKDIEIIIHSFLESSRIDYQQAAVTVLYYDFNMSDDRTIQLLHGLETGIDPYTARFSKLAIERIHKRIGIIAVDDQISHP